MDTADEILIVVTAGKTAVDHAAASGGRRVDNLAISGVDSRVRAGFTGVTGGVVEEDQIAGLEIADAVNPGTLAALPLTRCGMGQGVTELLVHVHGKAGAVEAAGGRAAVDIAGDRKSVV